MSCYVMEEEEGANQSPIISNYIYNIGAVNLCSAH